MKKQVIMLCFLTILILIYPINIFAAEGLNLTKEETEFIKNHPVIKLGIDPNFVPFEFYDENNEYKGITADYLELIRQKTGLEFEIQRKLTWPEAYDKALSGEIDVLPAVSKTNEREQHFIFSEPYYYFKRVIVTRNDISGINSIEDLNNLTVAVQRNSSHHSYLLSYPNINLSLYDSVETALTAVADGSEKVFVGNLATTNYLIKSNGITNLKFIAFEAEKQQALYFAVRKDWPELTSILNKALDSITQEDKIAINDKWIEFEVELDYGPIIRLILIIGSFVAAILGVSFYWIIRLRKEIRVREQIQKDLKKAKKEADEANEFKSGFMARMSHEIRTPLNAITGMAYLLKKTDISLTQSMYVDRITQASNNMLSIINDILDFSKIEAGKVEIEEASFSIDDIIQNVVNIVSYKIEEQEIGFRLSKDPQLPNWFIGDSKRIEQVLLNILNNAAKFTQKGEVALDIRLIAKESDIYHISFNIKDTGIGMTQQQVEKLFSPFVQGDSSINRRFGGSGLGLSIVKNLVEMMGGSINVFSTPDEGSTFIINLSLRADKIKEDEYLAKLSTKHFSGLRTLVLEKSGTSMNLIDSYLSSFGMHCELTSSEESALSMLEAADGKFAKPFDLIIIDYNTPASGGFRFVDVVHSNTKIAKMPKIIILLPMMREDLFDNLNEHNIDVGIGKPIIPSILLNAIFDIFNITAVSASSISTTKSNDLEKLDKIYKVLLVEDNKTNQMIAKSILEQVGIESIVANDGKIAVEKYKMHMNDISLILMDLHMPVMNGYEAAKEIRKISSEIPIVAMTADVILGVREKCEESGIHHYISKPFAPDKLISLVKEIIINSNMKELDKAENTNDYNEKVLDEEAGLKYMGGNRQLYHDILNEYLKENKNTADLISQAIYDRRYDDAEKLVHKIKSSSGSIGAKSLYEAAIRLQKSLSDNNDKAIEVNRLNFTILFNKLMKEIEGII